MFFLMTINGDRKPDAQRVNIGLKFFRVSGQSHPAIGLKQFRVGFSDSRNDFGGGFAYDILQSRQLFKGRVHFKVHKILGTVLVENHPATGEALKHVIEQGTIARFTLPQAGLQLFAFGDITGDASHAGYFILFI